MVNREGAKNSGGKKAGLLPATGNTGKRRPHRALIAVYFRLRQVTSVKFAGSTPESSFTWNHQPAHLAITCVTCGW